MFVIVDSLHASLSVIFLHNGILYVIVCHLRALGCDLRHDLLRGGLYLHYGINSEIIKELGVVGSLYGIAGYINYFCYFALAGCYVNGHIEEIYDHVELFKVNLLHIYSDICTIIVQR